MIDSEAGKPIAYVAFAAMLAGGQGTVFLSIFL